MVYEVYDVYDILISLIGMVYELSHGGIQYMNGHFRNRWIEGTYTMYKAYF